MKPLLRALRSTAAGTAGLLGTLGLRRLLLSRSLPPAQETLTVAGLDAAVHICFDRSGVPHVYGQTEADLFFAQGYCHARDRLWQMEVNRRVARGELAELFGERAVPADRFLRRLGFLRAAALDFNRMTAESRTNVTAYCAGVNAYVERHRLPIEFTLLRQRPRLWGPDDTLAFGRFMGWSLTFNWETELIRARLIAALGPEKMAALEPGTVAAQVPFAAGPPLPPAVESGRVFAPLANLLGGASNNWTLTGARTATGRPLLANDPHFRPRLPAAWYVIHLCGGDLNVIGAGMAGVLGVLTGHNAHVAWGITAAMTDGQDLYFERRDEQGRFAHGDDWYAPERWREEIRVKGQGEPVIEEVILSRHGPLLNGSMGVPAAGPPLAMRCVLDDCASPAEAILHLNKARDWGTFRQALAAWTFPVLNFVYADVDGNIGYQLAGRVPIRGQGDGYAPMPGWEPACDWRGLLPFEEMPGVFNPPEGAFATANSRPAVPCPHFLARDWADDSRWRRIMDLLQAKQKHTIEDCQSIQTDLMSKPAGAVGQQLTILLSAPETVAQLPAQAPFVLNELRSWGGRMSPESVAAAVCTEFAWQLPRFVYPDLAEPLLGCVLGKGTHELLAAVSAFHYRRSSNLQALLANEQNQPAIRAAFVAALHALAEKLGPSPQDWKWGRLHQILFAHPIGQAVPLLDRLLGLSRGPFPLGGDADTIAQGGIDPWHPYSAATYTVSYRQVFDVGNWDAGRFVLPTGQSGQPGSPHYDDLLPLWLNGDYRPLPFSRSAVEEATEQTIELRPSAP